MSTRAVNCMRYTLNIYDDGDTIVGTLPPSGQVVNVNEHTSMRAVDFSNIGHVPVATIDSDLDRVPNPMEGVSYIVSMRSLLAMHEKGYDCADIYAPSLLVKDASGRIVGCRRLMQMPTRK